MGMPAKITGRYISRYYHHRNRIEPGFRHSRCGIGQARPEVRHEDAWGFASLRARVSVNGVSSYLFVPDGNKSYFALLQRVQKSYHGMPAQAENMFHAAGFEELNQLESNNVFLHGAPPRISWKNNISAVRKNYLVNGISNRYKITI
jgi:hypothetical protein